MARKAGIQDSGFSTDCRATRLPAPMKCERREPIHDFVD